MIATSQQAFDFEAKRASIGWVYTCSPGRDGKYRWRAHRIQRVTDKCLYVTRRSVSLQDRDAGLEPPDEEKPYRLTRRWWERDGWHRHTDCRRSCLYARIGMERRPSPDEIAEENRLRCEREQRERAAWEAANPEQAAERRRRLEEEIRRLQEEMRRGLEDLERDGGGRDADARTLGLGTWPCSRADLKAAYRRRAKEAHPDCGGSAETFRRVNEAYERLATATGEGNGR